MTKSTGKRQARLERKQFFDAWLCVLSAILWGDRNNQPPSRDQLFQYAHAETSIDRDGFDRAISMLEGKAFILRDGNLYRLGDAKPK